MTYISSSQQEQQKKIFGKLFGNYPHASYLTGWKRSYVKRIFHDMPPLKDGTFLDVGTGSGFMVIEAVKRGMKSVGLDISPHAINLCKDLARKELDNNQFRRVKFVVGDAERLPFRSGEFDRVTSIALLEHLLKDKQAIKEISRVTKTDGLISICVPNTYEHTPFLLSILNKRNDKKVGHLRHYKAEDLISEFKKNNFMLVDLTYHGHTIMLINWVINLLWSNPPRLLDALWWWISKKDLDQKNRNDAMNFTITMKKKTE